MRNSQAIDFVRTQTYREIFKSALVYLEDTRDLNNQTLSIKLLIFLKIILKED